MKVSELLQVNGVHATFSDYMLDSWWLIINLKVADSITEQIKVFHFLLIMAYVV